MQAGIPVVRRLSFADISSLLLLPPCLRAALLAGIASHHAGQLPGWKALVERLFQRGLLRLIFATGEMWAVGQGMNGFGMQQEAGDGAKGHQAEACIAPTRKRLFSQGGGVCAGQAGSTAAGGSWLRPHAQHASLMAGRMLSPAAYHTVSVRISAVTITP